MVVWMRRHSADLKGDLQQRASLALIQGSAFGLVVMAFLAVLREGLETAVFMLAAFQQSDRPGLTGTGALPEYVTFTFPIFANPCLRTIRGSVECALDPDPATATFRVIPMPGTLDLAADAAVTTVGDKLRDALKDAGPPVYHGRP